MAERWERHQVGIYFAAILLGALAALVVPGITVLERAIDWALGLMLFVTFLQVPLAALGQALTRLRFLVALVIANFVVVPCLVWGLMQFLPDEPLVRLGFLFVLLTPCIDYVVTFSHLGQADSRLLLAATPVLLLLQMVLLPAYLGVFLDSAAADAVSAGPFVHAFVWLIAVPLVLAALVQRWAARGKGAEPMRWLSMWPVPATALVLFVVVASVGPQVGAATDGVLKVLPLYAVFALVAPCLGWMVARAVGVPVVAARAVAFSAGTRNSLVVLPLALAVPGAIPVVPAVIVTQTMVELLASISYVRVLRSWGA